MKQKLIPLALIACLLVGCTLTVPVTTVPEETAAEDTVESQTTTAPGLKGMVLGLNGKPAANVLMKSYLISNNSGKYQIQSEEEVRTDSRGVFLIPTDSTEAFNVEAIQADDVKAMRLEMTKTSRSVTLRLNYTGTIRGKVKASKDGVTDFLGTDVFIPGTGYLAKTDQDGNFEIANVPTGVFRLVAMHPDLGRAAIAQVDVLPKTTTTTSTMVLDASFPVLSSVTPSNGAPGQLVTLTGLYFGVSSGKSPQVLINGVTAEVVEASDTRLVARLPNGIVSGTIQVKVTELPSETKPFAVIKELSLYPSKDDFALPAPAQDYLAQGVSRTYEIKALDASGKTIDQPNVTWLKDNQAIGNGTIIPATPGTFTLKVQAGNLSSQELQVQATAPIQTLRVLPSVLPILNPVPNDPFLSPDDLARIKDSVQLTAETVMLDGSTQSIPVRWLTFDPRITVSNGLVKAVKGAESCDPKVTVKSIANPSKSLELTIPVRRQGDMIIEIE